LRAGQRACAETTNLTRARTQTQTPPVLQLPHTSLLAHGATVPPPVRVRVPTLRPFPAGILAQAVRPAAAAITVEGPVWAGVAFTAAAIIVGTAMLLGRLAAKRRASRSPEEPLFGLGRSRMPRPPRNW
jgi:hypothetical protein